MQKKIFYLNFPISNNINERKIHKIIFHLEIHNLIAEIDNLDIQKIYIF